MCQLPRLHRGHRGLRGREHYESADAAGVALCGCARGRQRNDARGAPAGARAAGADADAEDADGDDALTRAWGARNAALADDLVDVGFGLAPVACPLLSSQLLLRLG